MAPSNPTADLFEHRRQRLIELRQAVKSPYRYWFAAAIDVPDDYLARLELEPSNKANKNLGDRVIGKLQSAFRLAPGWFDRPLGSDLPIGCRIVSKDGEVDFPTVSATVANINDSASELQNLINKLQRMPKDKRDAVGHIINILSQEDHPPLGESTGSKRRDLVPSANSISQRRRKR